MARKKEPAYETEKYPFPSRLRKLMEERKTTQRELAQAIGVRPQTVSLYVQGQSFPDVNGLARIAIYFGISADYLIGNTDMPNVDLTMQEIHRITGLSAGAICKLQDIFKKNEKTAFSDIISLLIEDSNAEYFLACIAELISYSFDGTGDEVMPIDGMNMTMPKEKFLKTTLQINFIENLRFISGAYKRGFTNSPAQRKEEGEK